MPRADGRGGVLILRGLSADGGQPVVGQVIPDRLGKADGLTVIDGRNINASMLELVDERLIMIGTHSSPAGIADLTIEYCY